MNYTLINGDLLESDAKYICHQCNCITTSSSGIAAAIFNKFPYSNIYTHRESYFIDQLPLEGEQPGDIVIKGNGKDERYIINMMGQLYPGGIKYQNSTKDGELARQRFFKDCLLKIMKIEDLESIAFPFKIGCGLADGNWDIYEKLIDTFAKVMNNKNVKTYIYKYDENI